MFQLPQTTVINKPLYKKAVFEKFNLKAAERDHFDEDVSKMALVGRISTATVPALASGTDVEGFYVLQVLLKHKDYDDKNILLLNKLIPQHILFALQFEGETQFCIFHTRLQQSEWQPTSDAIIPLQGLTIDDVWNNIVATIGELDVTADTTLEEQILLRESREKLLLQIERLERLCRTEKQTRRKYELFQQIEELKKRLQNE